MKKFTIGDRIAQRSYLEGIRGLVRAMKDTLGLRATIFLTDLSLFNF